MPKKLARVSSWSIEAATKIFSQRKQNSLISAKIGQMEISTILAKMAHKWNFRKFPNLQMTSESSQNELWRCLRVQNGSPGSKESKYIIFRPILMIRHLADPGRIGRKIKVLDSVDPGDPFCTLERLRNSFCGDFGIFWRFEKFQIFAIFSKKSKICCRSKFLPD